MRIPALALVSSLLFATSAAAGPAAETLTKHLYAGTLTEGEAALAQSDDPESHAARGMLRFLMSVEGLAQALHRHGFETASGGPMMNFPILRIPVPPNPNPEKLDYQGFRAIFANFEQGLAAAEEELAKTGDADVKLPVDLMKVRLDLDGDGTRSDYETLKGLMEALMPGATPPEAVAAFDTADVYWLRGYTSFLGGFAQFVLAHDVQGTFDKTFHLYFPRAGLPYAEKLKRAEGQSAWSDPAIGDAIAFIHLINWPVAEPDRLKDSRLKFRAMADLSRKSWAAARRETDNDREWLPNAKQIGALVPAPVDDQVIDGWLAVMTEFEAILDGKKLLPHWRFNEGLNLKRMFEESKNFDLVLLIAGVDAVPWLEQGALTSSADWDSLTAVFRGNFLGYAVWFN